LRPAAAADTIWTTPNLLLQMARAGVRGDGCASFSPATDGESAGLLVFGQDYAWIGLGRIGNQLRLVVQRAERAERRERAGARERRGRAIARVLRVTVAAGGKCVFAYSLDQRIHAARRRVRRQAGCVGWSQGGRVCRRGARCDVLGARGLGLFPDR
jgi:hypothetical protein